MNDIAWAFLALAFALGASLAPVSRWRSAAFVVASWIAALLVLVGSIQTIVLGLTHVTTSTTLAILPAFEFTLDPLRGYFLLISAAVYACSVAFIARDAGHRTSWRGRVVMGCATTLFAAMLTVLLSAGIVSLLFSWEIMSLSLAALVFVGRGEKVEARAGLFALAYSEAGALAALAGLLVLAAAAGTTSLAGIGAAASTLPTGIVWAGFLLTFFGFGVKTGIIPVNAWMIDAYTAAPRGLLPVFSGATLNLGVFTLWTIDGPLASHLLWPALVIMAIGALTAVLGIMYALADSSMTRLLTHSSVENLGIVVTAMGAGFAFTAMGHPVLGAMALVASLYHMLNHSMYKTLLFLGSGGIAESVGHDDLDRLGGLLRRIPLFGTLFVLGCFAIASLPPFNGFVSEWLTLQSLLRVVEIGSIPVRIVFALCGALLALTAGLAVTCFVMLAATALLGLPRSREAAKVPRAHASTTVPMAVLTVICLVLGVLATGIIPVIGRLAASMADADAADALVPAFFGNGAGLAASVVHDLTQLGARLGHGLPLRGLVVLHSDGAHAPVVYAMSTALTFVVLAGMLLIVWAVAQGVRHRRAVARRLAWNAGIVRLQPEMAYTATTFAAPVRVLFHAVFSPEVAREEQRQGAFLTTRTHREVRIHILNRLLLGPTMTAVQATAGFLARMHHGKVTGYATYVLGGLVVVVLAAAAVLTLT